MQQLQDFLNECIKRGWKPRGRDTDKVICFDIRMELQTQKEFTERTYHDLFSVESWLMEFVTWKSKWEFVAYWDLAVYDCCEDYYYMMMGQMNATEKIQYFLDNALLPDNSCIAEQSPNILTRE